MPPPKGPVRVKQFHVQLQEDEHRRIGVVAAEEGVKAADLFRALFLVEINRRYEAITHRGAPKGRRSL